jgi:hypothetical protein
MDTFLQITPARRHLAFQQVDETMGLQAVSVEKDFWVCWTLRELFSLPGIGKHLTFKGGTSLSKAWKLIERFSEDIDIIVDKEALGFGGDAAPDRAPSNKQRKARLEALMDACAITRSSGAGGLAANAFLAATSRGSGKRCFMQR